MPNGKYGDSPITDMIVHGDHPFPSDMESMIKQLYIIDQNLLHEIKYEEELNWKKRKNLKQGREKLKLLLLKKGFDIDIIIRKHEVENRTNLVGGIFFILYGVSIWYIAYHLEPGEKLLGIIVKWSELFFLTIFGIYLLYKWFKNK